MRIAPTAAIVVILFAGLLGAAAPKAYAASATHAVTGTVTDNEGNPLGGVAVSGWSYGPDGSNHNDATTTADDGSFSLKLGAGKASVSAWLEKWRASASHEFEIQGDVHGITLTLTPPPPKLAVVEGIIRGADGQPLGGASVSIGPGCCYYRPMETEARAEGDAADGVEPPASPPTVEAMPVSDEKRAAPVWYDGDYQTATTDAEGKYRFETYSGPRQITVTAKGHAQSTLQIEAKDHETVDGSMQLVKVPASDARVKGRVVDAHTGLPIANAGVSINNVEWSRYAHATTGADGEFDLTTTPGWTQISVHHYGGERAVVTDAELSLLPAQTQSYYQWQTTLRLRSGDNPLDVSLEAKPKADVVLIGYVVDPNTQKGVPNANVNVWNQDTSDWGSATTDATGSYKLVVRAGHYTMSGWAEGHLPTSISFTIDASEKTKRVDLEMPAGETRYAPCEECDYPVMMEKGVADAPASSPNGFAATNARSAAPSSADASGESDAAGSSTRAAAFQGSGGGLPPYDPAKKGDAGIAGASNVNEQHNAVPAAALVLGLAALGVAALALRRK